MNSGPEFTYFIYCTCSDIHVDYSFQISNWNLLKWDLSNYILNPENVNSYTRALSFPIHNNLNELADTLFFFLCMEKISLISLISFYCITNIRMISKDTLFMYWYTVYNNKYSENYTRLIVVINVRLKSPSLNSWWYSPSPPFPHNEEIVPEGSDIQSLSENESICPWEYLGVFLFLGF